MSANIYYYQVKPVKNKEVPTWAPSSFMETMEKVFGDKLPTLSDKDIEKLSVLDDTFDSKDSPNPYEVLIEAIRKYGVIQLTA